MGGLVSAAGFSGHGFKFAPGGGGEILADLALSGDTEIPIGFLDGKKGTTGWKQAPSLVQLSGEESMSASDTRAGQSDGR